MIKSIMKELNEKINFSYIIETMTNLAYNINKDIRVKEYRFNEQKLLKEELKFECENFLYDIKECPQIKLDKTLSKHKGIIENYFNEKTININNEKFVYYEYKEDSNILLSLENNKIIYNNSFICEKTSVTNISRTDKRADEVSNYLMKENCCCEINGLNSLLEGYNKCDENLVIKNRLILEEVIKYVNSNYKDLIEFEEDCELAYTEIINEKGYILPVISYYDSFTEEIKSMYIISCKENYKNNYSFELNKIYDN